MIPFGATNSAKENSIDRASTLECLVGERSAIGIDRATSDEVFLEREVVSTAGTDCLKYPPCRGDDFRANSVTGEE